MPPSTRYITNSTELPAIPEPQALIRKQIDATMSSVRRPMMSARRPAKNAPPAHPNSIEATLKPVPTLSD